MALIKKKPLKSSRKLKKKLYISVSIGEKLSKVNEKIRRKTREFDQ